MKIAGALAAGCRAAFIARPQKALSPGGPRPEFGAQGVADLTAQLTAKRA